MARDRQEAGTCIHCEEGTVLCTHNTFADESVKIDSWEHRCSDCGRRKTEAIRTGGEDDDPNLDPLICPFCGRKAC